MTILDAPLAAPVFDLARYGEATAVVCGDRAVTYTELDRLVEERRALLGTGRRLVLLECANELTPLVTYLAAVRGHHPVLLVPRLEGEAAHRHRDRLLAAYDPDVCVTGTDDWAPVERRQGSAHELHPDLAVLLGTSGSTGTPKLVRLSRENLVANATAIAGFLALDGSSRAATTLPLQYCFGLSVVNSHLLAGGSLWLTDSSVVDPGFPGAFAAAGATSFAGVPYTFELLERSGTDWTVLPGLRQVQQAGGRMEPSRVRSIAERLERRGVELFVMYGQTEATARMAYLPPHLAASRPGCIGIPVEGGDLRIEDGELVYSGANVMLGYAATPADLALGRTVTELRTGDLAIQHEDGLFEITGRCNRLAKLYGVRLDLDQAERLLAEGDVEARLLADAEHLRAFVLDPGQVDRVAGVLVADHCLPVHAVQVQVVPAFPVTAAGKPDYPALAALAPPASHDPVDVRGAFVGVFGRAVEPGDTFVSLGGDSLLYVETFVRLERLLGEVPPDWPHRTVVELAGLGPSTRRRWARVEMPVVLRALAMILIVGSHAQVWDVMGGAHVLLALVGYSMARFALGAPTRSARLRALGRSVRDLLVPSFLVIGTVAALSDYWQWPSAVMLNNRLGENSWTNDWQLWFLETATWTTVLVVALVAVPSVDRLLQRFTFGAPLVLFLLAVALREWHHYTPGLTQSRYSFERTAWCIVLGWLILAARTPAQRLLVSALVPAALLGFFPGMPLRVGVIIAGMLLLLWVRSVPVPRPLDRVLGTIASASLFIYLLHFLVYPELVLVHPALGFAVSIGVGLAGWSAYSWVRQGLAGTRRPKSRVRPGPGVPSRT